MQQYYSAFHVDPLVALYFTWSSDNSCLIPVIVLIRLGMSPDVVAIHKVQLYPLLLSCVVLGCGSTLWIAVIHTNETNLMSHATSWITSDHQTYTVTQKP